MDIMVTIGELHDSVLKHLSLEMLNKLEKELNEIPREELLANDGRVLINRQILLASIYQWKDKRTYGKNEID